MKKICIFGLGYIGLPTSCLFATNGYRVLGIDLKEDVVEKVNRGIPPFEEPGLKKLLKEAHTNLQAGFTPESSDVFLIAVPTPMDNNIGVAALKSVFETAETITRYLQKGNLVIVESTVPPLTCEKMVLPILEKSGLIAGKDFYLAYCPERAIPSNTVSEMIHNDRVIGGLDDHSAELARQLYACFVKGNIYLTDLRTAAMVKLMENIYRDVNIALANELATITERIGVNVWEAIQLANKHPRVNIHNPGPGVGGHCLTKDSLFLMENTTGSRIIELARDINDAMPRYVLTGIERLIGNIKNPLITILGVAYKANVDDVRETPALKLIKLTENAGYIVKAHDPWVKKFEYQLYSLEEAVKDSDCIVLVTDHAVFQQLDPFKLGPLMRNRNLIDTRNCLSYKKWIQAAFKVKILGNGILEK